MVGDAFVTNADFLPSAGPKSLRSATILATDRNASYPPPQTEHDGCHKGNYFAAGVVRSLKRCLPGALEALAQRDATTHGPPYPMGFCAATRLLVRRSRLCKARRQSQKAIRPEGQKSRGRSARGSGSHAEELRACGPSDRLGAGKPREAEAVGHVGVIDPQTRVPHVKRAVAALEDTGRVYAEPVRTLSLWNQRPPSTVPR